MSVENVAREGIRHGLHLTLDPIQEEQIIWGRESGGLVMVVHPQGVMPFPEDDGLLLSPGRATSVALTKV